MLLKSIIFVNMTSQVGGLHFFSPWFRPYCLFVCLLIYLFVCVFHGSDIMTSTTSGLQILVTLSRRYVMTSVMISHIIIWQHQSIVPRNF